MSEQVKGGELFIVDNSNSDWKGLRYPQHLPEAGPGSRRRQTHSQMLDGTELKVESEKSKVRNRREQGICAYPHA